jgi:hypothetical protein
MLTFSGGMVVGDVRFDPGMEFRNDRRWRAPKYVGSWDAVYVVGQPCDWETAGNIFGAQPAKYMKDNLVDKAGARLGESGFKVHCQECGKVCTKARGGEVLTRKTVVCGKCHDEAKHGPCSSTTNHHRA